MADEKDPNEATEFAETLHRHGDPDPKKWEEAEAVTGRPADKPTANSTLADRAKARKAESKRVDEDDTENKAVTSAATKAKRTRKSS